MPEQKNKLYLFLSGACLAGYGYIFVMKQDPGGQLSQLGPVCLFKRFTHFPCPSCGATRSVLALLQGEIGQALYWNPLGLILVLLLVLFPLWLAYDTLRQQDSLYLFYHRMESLMRRRLVAIPAAALVLGNWIWNIYKGL
jgi:hypothetical protein